MVGTGSGIGISTGTGTGTGLCPNSLVEYVKCPCNNCVINRNFSKTEERIKAIEESLVTLTVIVKELQTEKQKISN